MLEFLSLLARRWRILVAMLVVGVAAAGAITYQMTPTYRASAQLFVALDAADNAIELNSAANFSSQRVKSYPDVVDSPLVLEPVITELGLDETPTSLADRVQAEVSPNTVLIEVSVDDASPDQAAAIANATATNLADVVEELDRTDDDTSPVRVSLTRPAIAPSQPRSPIPPLNLAIGLLAGAALGLALAALRDALDKSVKSEADITESVGLPTLAQVPVNSGVTDSPLISVAQDGNPVWAESYRMLRTNLSFVDPDNPSRVISITSALPGDGKSLTAANLASSLAQTGRRTVLVEADLRRPSLASLLELDGQVGVTSVVTGKVSVDQALQECHGFQVMTSGPIPPNPSELLGSHAFESLIRGLAARFDNVVIDTPPLVAVTDGAVVGARSDQVVLVVRAKKSKRADVRRALVSLRAVDAQVAGVVLNQVPRRAMTYYQYDYTPRRAKGRS